MGLLERIRHIVKANVGDLIANAEEPERMLGSLVEEMEDSLAEARAEAVLAGREERRLKSLELENAAQAERAERQARLALKKGDDHLAREALIRRAEFLRTAADLHAHWETQRSSVVALERLLAALQRKIGEARARRDLLAARQRLAAARRALAQAVGQSPDDPAGAFERIEDRIAGDEVIAELSEDPVERRFKEMESASPADDIEAELDRLKQELAAEETAA
jgi:phage shock protein A